MFFIVLAFIAAMADVAGGLLFLNSKAARLLGTRYTVAFASGVLISLAFFELIPEANVASNAAFLALGFFVFYLIEKLAMLHACGEKECEVHGVGWIAALGMASDNVLDGVGIATGYLLDPTLGLLIALGVVAHEIPQAITSATLMINSGFRLRKMFTVLVSAGAMYIVGALLSGLIPEAFYTAIIAFVAGSFLYIGAGDLLLEAHKRFNIKVVGVVVVSAALMFALESLA